MLRCPALQGPTPWRALRWASPCCARSPAAAPAAPPSRWPPPTTARSPRSSTNRARVRARAGRPPWRAQGQGQGQGRGRRRLPCLRTRAWSLTRSHWHRPTGGREGRRFGSGVALCPPPPPLPLGGLGSMQHVVGRGTGLAAGEGEGEGGAPLGPITYSNLAMCCPPPTPHPPPPTHTLHTLHPAIPPTHTHTHPHPRTHPMQAAVGRTRAQQRAQHCPAAGVGGRHHTCCEGTAGRHSSAG
jgi:hypothetical protein